LFGGGRRVFIPGRSGLDGAVTTDDVLAAVNAWYARVRLASLELPGGWFGRPHDNLHQLTWTGATQHKVLLELDRQLLLILTDPDAVEESELEFRVVGCAQVTLDWQEFGNLKPHLEGHGPGTARFVAQAAAMRR